MLKHLLLAGWFRVQPFLKYVVVVMLITPLVADSGHSTSAKQLQAARIASVTGEFDSVSQETAAVGADLAQVSKVAQIDALIRKYNSVPTSLAVVTESQELQVDHPEAWTIEDNSLSRKMPGTDPLAAVELAPPILESDVEREVKASQLNLAQRLKAYKNKEATREDSSVSSPVLSGESLSAAKISPTFRESQPNSTAVPIVEEPDSAQLAAVDPIGSPHPIPWKWIQATQEAVSSKGGSGVRYYRSVPVISPDGRYAIYSRVQLEVNPEMHNSRVTSVLFVEDMQTKKLRVVSSTSRVNDPLLKVQTSQQSGDTQGTIAVLVPVSWSEEGGRFLARKFEGLMNTSDVTDHAVIWDRQKNHSHSVTPSHEEHQHEIAVLLGWSKAQPDHVLFRAGEMGDENWPLVTVADDGKTGTATNADQAVTFGEKVKDVWAGPQVAYR